MYETFDLFLEACIITLPLENMYEIGYSEMALNLNLVFQLLLKSLPIDIYLSLIAAGLFPRRRIIAFLNS